VIEFSRLSSVLPDRFRERDITLKSDNEAFLTQRPIQGSVPIYRRYIKWAIKTILN